MITGRILGDDAPLSGVAVSNGSDIVRSGVDGSYILNDADADYPFVFVNLPAGWMSESPFYQRVRADTNGYDFHLRAAPQRGRDGLRIAHVTDSHIGAPPIECFATAQHLADALRRVIDESTPDLIVVTGDLTNLGSVAELEAYRDVVTSIDTPIISLTSGHDYLEELDRLEPGQELHTRHTYHILGVEQYSFDWGPYHILLYPETHRDPSRAARLRRFMAQDIAMQPPGTPIIIVTHDPPRAYPEKHPPDYGPSLVDILQYPTVPLILHGQYHIARVIRYKGAWVVGLPCLLMGAIDTHAPAYGIYDLWDKRVTVTLRSLAHTNPLQAPPPPANMTTTWRRAVAGCFHRAAPLVSTNGETLFMPSSDMGNPAMYGIYAISASDGTTRWFTPTDEVVKNSCVQADDRLVAVTVAGQLLCLRLDTGEVLWQRRLPTYPDRWLHVRPSVQDGRIYITNYAIRTCFNMQTGEMIWHHHETELFDNAYAASYQEPLYHRGMIWQVDHRFTLHAIDTASGDVVARYDLNLTEENRAAKGEPSRMFQGQIASPIVCDDHIVAPGAADQIGVLDSTSGNLLWLKPVLEVNGKASLAGDGRSTRPSEFTCGLAAGNGHFFASSASGDVFCIRLTTGEVVWHTHLGDSGLASMVPYYREHSLLLTRPVLANGHVYVGGSDGRVSILDATNGTLKNSAFLGVPITAPPAVYDGSITVFAYDGSIWRFAQQDLISHQ